MTQRGKQTLGEACLPLPLLYLYHTQVGWNHMKRRCDVQKVRASSEKRLRLFFHRSGEKKAPPTRFWSCVKWDFLAKVRHEKRPL